MPGAILLKLLVFEHLPGRT